MTTREVCVVALRHAMTVTWGRSVVRRQQPLVALAVARRRHYRLLVCDSRGLGAWAVGMAGVSVVASYRQASPMALLSVWKSRPRLTETVDFLRVFAILEATWYLGLLRPGELCLRCCVPALSSEPHWQRSREGRRRRKGVRLISYSCSRSMSTSSSRRLLGKRWIRLSAQAGRVQGGYRNSPW
jgi:hypothetical protein